MDCSCNKTRQETPKCTTIQLPWLQCDSNMKNKCHPHNQHIPTSSPNFKIYYSIIKRAMFKYYLLKFNANKK